MKRIAKAPVSMFAVLLIALLAGPALAENGKIQLPTATDAELGLTAVNSAIGDSQAQRVDLGSKPNDGGATRSYCSANCQGNGSATTSCAGNCQAFDRSCPSQAGHVTCNGAIVDTCDPCPTPCLATITCPDGTILSCTSLNGNCSEMPCFVGCDGLFQLCPMEELLPACLS